VDNAPAALENRNQLHLYPGVVLRCNSTDCDRSFVNDAGARLQVDAVTSSSSSTVTLQDAASLFNQGTVVVPSGETLLLTAGHSALHGGSFQGPGSVTLGPEAIVDVYGVVGLSNGARLLLDGDDAELHGVRGILDAAGTGTFVWQSGLVDGTLNTHGSLRTSVVAGPTHDVDIADGDTRSLLTFGSPTSIAGTEITLSNAGTAGSAVTVAAPLTLSGADAGFTAASSLASGERVWVSAAGSIQAAGAGTSGHIDTHLLVNGALTVDGASLQVPDGYTQSGTTASTTLENGALLSTVNDTGYYQDVTLAGGTVNADGTIDGPVVNGGATLTPSADGTTPGTLAITDGYYQQQAGGQLLLHVAGTGFDALTAAGDIALDGALQVVDETGSSPRGTTIAGVVTGQSRTGSFATVGSTGAPAGTAWTPAYTATGFDLTLS
jgi:hypothetical protein